MKYCIECLCSGVDESSSWSTNDANGVLCWACRCLPANSSDRCDERCGGLGCPVVTVSMRRLGPYRESSELQLYSELDNSSTVHLSSNEISSSCWGCGGASEQRTMITSWGIDRILYSHGVSERFPCLGFCAFEWFFFFFNHLSKFWHPCSRGWGESCFASRPPIRECPTKPTRSCCVRSVSRNFVLARDFVSTCIYRSVSYIRTVVPVERESVNIWNVDKSFCVK